MNKKTNFNERHGLQIRASDKSKSAPATWARRHGLQIRASDVGT